MLTSIKLCTMSNSSDDEMLESTNQEYLEFIRITRQHQKEREKQKSLKKNSEPVTEEYYIDVSQVNTVIESNLAEVPQKNDGCCSHKKTQAELIKRYGKDSYEKIHAMEMYIDDHFKKKCQELSPFYWPVIPINPKPYLNPLKHQRED